MTNPLRQSMFALALIVLVFILHAFLCFGTAVLTNFCLVHIRNFFPRSLKFLADSSCGNIAIKGLEQSVDVYELHDAFSIFGNILSCEIAFNENGTNTGCAFVYFETMQSADAGKQYFEVKER